MTGSEKLLDELLYQTKASFSQIKVQAVRGLAKIALSGHAEEQVVQKIVTKLTDLLKARDKDNVLVNEAVIALQSIINSSGTANAEEADELIALKTRKQVILHCAKRLQSTPNAHAKAMMINLLSK